MKLKMALVAAALFLSPVAAQAAMECCKNCACCKEMGEAPSEGQGPPSADHH